MDMLRRYVNMYSADLQNGFDKFNPLDNMNDNSRIVLKDRCK